MTLEQFATEAVGLFKTLVPQQEAYLALHGVYQQTAQQQYGSLSVRCVSYGQPDGWDLLATATVDSVAYVMAINSHDDPARSFSWSPVPAV